VSESTTVNGTSAPSAHVAIPLKTRLRTIFRSKTPPTTGKSHKMLGEWRATAIAGNDISSSCLYTAGICAQKGENNPFEIFSYQIRSL